MSIQGTREKLQTLHGAISGVTRAPAAFPPSIEAMDVPMALTWPGPGSSYHLGMGGLRRQDREYIVRVYVKAAAQGTSHNEVWREAETLLQAFIAAYLNTANTAQNNNSAQVTIMGGEGDITDGGLQVLTYPPGLPPESGTAYYGFELRVRVYEKW